MPSNENETLADPSVVDCYDARKVARRKAEAEKNVEPLTEQQKAEILPGKYGLSYQAMIDGMVMIQGSRGYYMGIDRDRRLPPRTAAIRALNLCLKAITADGRMEKSGRVQLYREIERTQYILECSRRLDEANDPSKDPWLTGAPDHEGEFYAHFGKSREALNSELELPPGSPWAPNYRPPTSGESIRKVAYRLRRSCRWAKDTRPWNKIPANHFLWGYNRCKYIMHSISNRDFGGFRWNDWSNFETDRPCKTVKMDGEWVRI